MNDGLQLLKNKHLKLIETPQTIHFSSLNYKSPILQFCPKENRKLRKLEKVYETKVKRISKQTNEEFNLLFSKYCVKKRLKTLQQSEHAESGSQIHESSSFGEDSFINTSKILKAINLIEGSSNMNHSLLNSTQDNLKTFKLNMPKIQNQNTTNTIEEVKELSDGNYNSVSDCKHQNVFNVNSNEPIFSTESENKKLSPKYVSDSIDNEEKPKWNKIMKYMKKNPDLLIDLIADSNSYKYGYVTSMVNEESTPYIDSQANVQIPTQRTEKTNENILVNKNNEQSCNPYYNTNVSVRKVMRTRMKERSTNNSIKNTERVSSFLKKRDSLNQANKDGKRRLIGNHIFDMRSNSNSNAINNANKNTNQNVNINKSKTQAASIRAVSARRELKNLNKIYERKIYQIGEQSHQRNNDSFCNKLHSKSAIGKRKNICRSPEVIRPKTNKLDSSRFRSVNRTSNNYAESSEACKGIYIHNTLTVRRKTDGHSVNYNTTLEESKKKSRLIKDHLSRDHSRNKNISETQKENCSNNNAKCNQCVAIKSKKSSKSPENVNNHSLNYRIPNKNCLQKFRRDFSEESSIGSQGMKYGKVKIDSSFHGIIDSKESKGSSPISTHQYWTSTSLYRIFIQGYKKCFSEVAITKSGILCLTKIKKSLCEFVFDKYYEEKVQMRADRAKDILKDSHAAAGLKYIKSEIKKRTAKNCDMDERK